ncbi:MAG: HlyC/CorC family transporter [Acidobacteria bacterium]|nr:HlyC/CorC family transporter [Acidobacteriota bacterium]MBV9475214.1 HlyC/CorC family transporter [Acidobacteriota bacterium]
MSAWYLLLALFFVLANGFFVAAEFAIVKVRPTQLTEGGARARMTRRVHRRLDAYLAACQVGITFASLALGWVGEPAFATILMPLLRSSGAFAEPIAHSISATVSFILISALHIIFGEQVPKFLAIQKSAGTALWTAHVLHGFYVFTYPAIWVLRGLTNAALRLFRIHPAAEDEAVHSVDELRMILASSEKAGILSEENREIIEGVFQFSKRTARQIMVPRTDVVILSTTKSIEENLETIRTTRHTRYPLCEGTLDQTVGLIHVKDLLLAQLRGPGRKLEDLKRDILFVPENSTVESLLSQFIEQKTHMAVVVDEYGGSSGIVSLENITEELFGQIQDEFDRERPEIEPLGNGRYRVRGDYLIEDLADRLKIDVGEPEEETVGGYVAARLGREAMPGDRVELRDLTITVLEAERFRVRWVTVETKLPATEPAEEEEERDAAGV